MERKREKLIVPQILRQKEEIMKKLLSIALAGLMCVTSASYVPVTAADVTFDYSAVESLNAATSGQCGDNLTWDLSGGTLTISGSGEMYLWMMTEYVPWRDNVNDIRSVVLSEGVTQIGRCAFANCKNLTSVNIPSTVEVIGAYAFKGCTSLGSITIPATVATVGNYAFQESGLSALIVEGSNTKIVGTAETVGGATIYAPEGSLAAKYAKSVKVNYSSSGAPSNPTPTPTPTAPPATTTTTARPTTTTTAKPTTTTAKPTTTTAKPTTTTAKPTTTTAAPTTTVPVTTTVEVTEPPVTTTDINALRFQAKVEVADMPSKVNYGIGEKLDTAGLTMDVWHNTAGNEQKVYSKDHVSDHSDRYIVSELDSSTPGMKQISVTYQTFNNATGEWVYASTHFWVDVISPVTTTEPPVTTVVTTTVTPTAELDFRIVSEPSKKYYEVGEPLDLSDATVMDKVTFHDRYGNTQYIDSGEKSVLDYDIDASSYNNSIPGIYPIRVTKRFERDGVVAEKTVSFDVTVKVPVVTTPPATEPIPDNITYIYFLNKDTREPIDVRGLFYITPSGQSGQQTMLTAIYKEGYEFEHTSSAAILRISELAKGYELEGSKSIDFRNTDKIVNVYVKVTAVATTTTTTVTTTTVTTTTTTTPVTTTTAPPVTTTAPVKEVVIDIQQPSADLLKVGNTFKINYTTDSDMKMFYAYPSDMSIASVTNDGVVTLLKSGKVVINMGFRDNKWNVEQRSITLNIPNSGIATDYMLGDINLDGTVNASDATAALSEYARLSTGEKGMFSEKQMLAGDIDRNGQINATDATMILSYYSFLSTGGSGPMEDYINR